MDVDGSPKRARKEKEKANDEFRSIKASIVLAVPPVFANRLHSGVEEMLDTMIMRCSTFLSLKPLPSAHLLFFSFPAGMSPR